MPNEEIMNAATEATTEVVKSGDHRLVYLGLGIIVGAGTEYVLSHAITKGMKVVKEKINNKKNSKKLETVTEE